jgi:hypothetical protein
MDLSLALRPRDRLCFELLCAGRGDAIGAALAYLLIAAERDPGQVQAALRAACRHEAAPGGACRIIDVLAAIAK